MKKIIGYILFVVILIFTMPIVFTDQFNQTQETSSEELQEKYEKANYGDFNTIKLLHNSTRRSRRNGI